MKNKIIIRIRQIDGSWVWKIECEDVHSDWVHFYDLKSSAIRAAKRALARIQSCKNVEVVCDD